jgi:CDP-4-dehydro-6-deoxyglucose reductase, E1
MNVQMEFRLYLLNGVINTMNKVEWPLMVNNIERSDLDLLIDYLKQDDPKLTHGPKVVEFENKWSEWLGVKYSVMLNSGSSANDITMLALRELRGTGEVIVPALTWVSDIASVLHAQMTPVFVDIDPRSLAMDTEKILESITSKTKAVFLTHILGYNGLTDKLISELSRLNIPLIEDVCESHGATHNGKKAGSIGLASNFSFYYAHHMTTIEGGMICTNDESLFDVARMLRSHGMVRESLNMDTRRHYVEKYPDLNPDFIFAHFAHNMRPTELNGILGLSQLRRLDANNKKRTTNLERFLSELDISIFRTDFETKGSSNYAFTLVLRKPDFTKRDKVEALLRENGVEFRRGLSGGGNQLRQPYIRNMGTFPKPESLTNTDHVHHFAWYIGNYPELGVDRIDWLCDLLHGI